jgi:hypothetical protein
MRKRDQSESTGSRRSPIFADKRDVGESPQISERIRELPTFRISFDESTGAFTHSLAEKRRVRAKETGGIKPSLKVSAKQGTASKSGLLRSLREKRQRDEAPGKSSELVLVKIETSNRRDPAPMSDEEVLDLIRRFGNSGRPVSEREQPRRYLKEKIGKNRIVESENNSSYTDYMDLEKEIKKFATAVDVPNEALEFFSLAVVQLVSTAKNGTHVGEKSLPLPKKAPELFVKRRDPKETIVEFLRRVWKPWMDAGSVTRNDLRRLDPSAARGIENWLAKGPLPDDIKVPTKKELNDARIAHGGVGAILSSPDLASVYAARLRRQARIAKPS